MTDSQPAPEPSDSPVPPVPPTGDEVDEAYRPAPTAPEPPARVPPLELEEDLAGNEPARLDEDRQLSIRQMFVALALVSGLFALLRLLPASAGAFIMALFLVGGLWANALSGPFSLIANVIWWGAFVVWLLMCLVAAGFVP